MKPLSAYAIKQIDAHDYQAHRKLKDNRNVTRFYIYLTRNGQDVEVRTVAVKSRKDGSVCVKEVIRASVDDVDMYALDVVFHHMSGYIVDWSREKLGRKHEWNYRGKWGDHMYHPRDPLFKLDRPVINADIIKRVRRFKYCCYTPACGKVLDYLKTYVQHPRVEMLVKAGMERFARLNGFLKQLEGDKALTRFVMQNADEIKKKHYGVDVIRKAYGEHLTLSEANSRIKMNRWMGFSLPGNVDAQRAYFYIKSHDIHVMDYRHYLEDCLKAGFNLQDTKNAFPKRPKNRMKVVKDVADEIRRRERIIEDKILRKKQIEERKMMNTNIAAVSKKLSRLEKIQRPFRVILPRCEADFIKEGDKLDHCVNGMGYAASYARGERIIAFIRKTRAVRSPFFTVEFSKEFGKVIQCYGLHHKKPDERVLKFIHGAFTKAAKRIAKAI
jgi:hypothetical protein